MGSKEGHSDGGAVADGDLHRRRPSKFAERKQIYKRIKRARVALVICVPKRGTAEKQGFQGGGSRVTGSQGGEHDEQGRSEYKVLTKRLAINQFANNEYQPKGDSALRKTLAPSLLVCNMLMLMENQTD